MTGRQSMIVTLAVCVTVVLASFATLQGQQNARPEPTRIAVVDVNGVFENLAERRAIEAEIQSQLEGLRREQTRRRVELEELENDYEILVADSDAARQVREQLEQKVMEFEVWQQISSRRVESERALRTAEIYRKMMDVVENVAEREGYDMVLFKDPAPQFRNAREQQQVVAQIQSRKVLYASDHADLSARILQRMNNDFES